MGLFSFKRQTSSVIEWTTQSPSALFHKIDTATDEVKNASKLIVAPAQGCLLVYDGKVADVLTESGTFFLETDNHPFITTLLKLRQNFEIEHKMRFYFFRTAEMVNIGWGTSSPIKYKEPQYGFPVSMGAYGNFSIRIADAESMFINLIGVMSDYTADDVQELVSSRVITILSSYFSKSSCPYSEIDSHLIDMSNEMKGNIEADLNNMGLLLTDFRIEGTKFDDDTTKRINTVANMTAEAISAAEVGLSYTELEKLRALRDAARTEGNLAGAGLQIGAGVELSRSLLKQESEKRTEETINNSAIKDDALTQLKQLKLMLDEQLITQTEYDKKKEEILKRL